MDIKSLIRNVPDFPKPGIIFRDITTLLQDHKGMSYVLDEMVRNFKQHDIDYIVAIESRGFILGAPLAYHLSAGFVPVRKPGKLPAQVHSVEYQLEYGTDRLEIHKDAIKPGGRVLVVDDVIATGGTAAATARLLDQFDCELLGFAFIIELTALAGRELLPENSVHSLVQY